MKKYFGKEYSVDFFEETTTSINIDTYIPGKIICVGMNYKSHVKEQDGRFPYL